MLGPKYKRIVLKLSEALAGEKVCIDHQVVKGSP